MGFIYCFSKFVHVIIFNVYIFFLEYLIGLPARLLVV
jgi:hypothetical protein